MNNVENSKIKYLNEGDNNTIDKSFNENSFNTTNIINIYPKAQSKKEKDKEREKRQRPYLADREGKLVKGYGYIVKTYNDNFVTVINLTDLNGVYIADHIQLDLKEDIYHYNFKSNFIQFEGYPYKYIRKNGTVDYGINISKPIIFLENDVCNCNYTEHYFDIDLDYDKFLKYFYKVEFNDLFRLLNKLSERLDKLTIEFGKRFVYNNIINNFMLYNATYDLYNEELQNNMINLEGLISLILIMASTIFRIETNKLIDIGYVLRYIAFSCNLEQGIYTYKQQSVAFEKFCNNVNIGLNSKKLRKAWSKIMIRKFNFGNDPNPISIDKNILAESAYLILNDYI